MPMNEASARFRNIRDLFVIHTSQILKLDRKPPMYAVALVVTVACEVLAKLFPDEGDKETLFARNFSPKAPLAVGRLLYQALRNGLAHAYDPQPIVVGGSNVRLVLSWKGEGHLRAIGLRRDEAGHNHAVPIEQNEFPGPFVCIVAEQL